MDEPNNLDSKDDVEVQKLYSLMLSLPNSQTRYTSLKQLYERKDHVYFSKLFFSTFGCVTSLVHEIISAYAEVTFNNLNPKSAKRIKSVLGILQTLTKDKEARVLVVNYRLISLLLPFLYNIKTDSVLEYIQIASLGVIFDVVTIEDDKLAETALTADLFQVLSRVIDHSNRLARMVALYTLLRILIRDVGINALFFNKLSVKCIFNSLTNVIKIVIRFPDKLFVKILKHTIKCYKRLFDYRNNTSYPIVKEIPIQISDPIILKLCSEDKRVSETLQNLIDDVMSEKRKKMQEVKKTEPPLSVFIPPISW